jgi:hypothetical protein
MNLPHPDPNETHGRARAAATTTLAWLVSMVRPGRSFHSVGSAIVVIGSGARAQAACTAGTLKVRERYR